jgi:hypothetical protein
MLLLHMQIRRYFNKICDNAKYKSSVYPCDFCISVRDVGKIFLILSVNCIIFLRCLKIIRDYQIVKKK